MGIQARFALLVFVILASFAWLVLRGKEGRDVPSPEPLFSRSSPVAALSPTPVATPSPFATHTQAAVDRAGSLADRPSTQVLREEVAADPHVTAPSLLRFAEQVGERMEAAKHDELRAETLLPELARCAQDPATASAARALCMRSAERLARWHPELEQQVESLRAR